jgi:1-acyl-sn-glycerol-3-phosphate acyltransferase
VPGLGLLFRDAKVIPVATGSEDETERERSLERISAELSSGELVCLFPERSMSSDGRLSRFDDAVARIVERVPAVAVPIALTGLWGSFFSRCHGRAMTRPFRRFWSRVGVKVGEPVPAAEVTAAVLAGRVADLGGWQDPHADNHAEA